MTLSRAAVCIRRRFGEWRCIWWSLGQPRWRASANLARPSSRHLPSVTTATVETWIAAAAVGSRAGHEADRYVPLRYRSIYRPSQKLPFTTGGFGSTPVTGNGHGPPVVLRRAQGVNRRAILTKFGGQRRGVEFAGLGSGLEPLELPAGESP